MGKRCFVIQGFGKKQDYQQGKQFDLDASYVVIKDAIENAGMECFRADEIKSSVMIDKIMYQQLLSADLVVADITTLNFNAAYELGVRLALRPYATIVVAEDGINFPFDVNHIPIRKYRHLGEEIGYNEAKRFQKELTELAQKVVASKEEDSPVYRFLDHLPEKGYIDFALQTAVTGQSTSDKPTLRNLTDQAKQALDRGDFTDAVSLWQNARDIAGKDDYIVQQLALATYKSKTPDEEQALRSAKTILEYLKPHESFDTETLGLWGSVHKRLFDLTKSSWDLGEAIFALERGFFIKQDYYNGINLAFMILTKADCLDSTDIDDLCATTRYIYRKVKTICISALNSVGLKDDERYWVVATMHEACVGLGEEGEAKTWKENADRMTTADWMKATSAEQISKLRALLKRVSANADANRSSLIDDVPQSYTPLPQSP